MKRGLIEDLLTGGLGTEAIEHGEVPEGWSSKELKEICSIHGEYGANAPKSDYDPSLPRYVRITDIDAHGNLQEATVVSIPREKAASYILDEGDIVIARSGATVGKSYIHTADNGECAFAGYLVRFRLRPEIASHDWLKYVLQSKPYWNWVRDNQRAGAQPNINAKEYGSYLLKVPPLVEQQRIAKILGSIDKQMSQNRRVVAQLQRLKRGLIEDLLTGGLGTEAIEHGEVPEGWSSKELKEICSIRGEYGANAPKSNYDPSLPRYVRITDIDDHGNLKEATAVSIPYEKAASYILDEGDITIARSGTVGKSYIHTADNGECAFAGYLVRFRLRPEIASYGWLKYVLQSKPYWDWVRDNQRVGAQPNINAKEYGSYPLKVPPLVEQQRIARILDSINEQISQNRRVVAQFQRLKRGLMDDLLTGRVRTTS